MATATCYLDGIGAIGPGFADWPALAAQLRGDAPAATGTPTALPPPATLPPAERRRAGTGIKASIAAGLEACAAAGREPATLPSVFTASGGDGDNCNAICAALASPNPQDWLLSPTRFHNSVHNAPSGYWSISTGATPTASVLCAHDGSFAAGLLEAMTQCVVDGVPVLLVAYDTPYPEPLHAVRPIDAVVGLALVLAPQRSATSTAALHLDGVVAEPATPLADAALEALRTGVPAARALPLLACVARGAPGRVVLDYLDATTRLGVQVEAW